MGSLFRLTPALLLLTLTAQAADTPAPLSISDMMKITSVMEVKLSPDARYLACILADADFKTNQYIQSVWRVDCATGQRQRLSAGPVAISPCWSPDSTKLAFLEQDAKQASVCVLSIGAEQVEQRWKVPRKTHSLAWAPTGDRLAFLAPEATPDDALASPLIDIRLESADQDQLRLFVLELAGEEPRQLTRDGHVPHFDWAPDGEQLAFAQQPGSKSPDDFHSDLHVLQVSEGTSRLLVQRPGMDLRPRWSPDGKRIAFVSQDGQTGWLAPTRICVALAGGEDVPQMVSAAMEESLGARASDSLTWSREGTALFFPVDLGSSRQLFRLDPASRQVEVMTRGECVHQHFSFSGDGKQFACCIDQPSMPADIYVSPVGTYEPRKLVELNPHLRERRPGDVQSLKWKSLDGTPVEGVLITPPERNPDVPVPLIVCLHGGPGSGFRLRFAPESSTVPPQILFCPVHVLAGRGYAVLCPNPRGSDGYGRSFREGNLREWGQVDLEDVLSGVDELIRLKIADPGRLAVTGYCYGGYLSLQAITQTNRFRAACIGAGFGDLVAMYGQTDIPPLFEAYFGGPPWTHRPAYERCSPLLKAHIIQTPVLMFHAEKDQRVPWTQSKQLHTVLTKVGTPVELYTYPRGGHTVVEPRMNAETMRRAILWYDRWLQQGE